MAAVWEKIGLAMIDDIVDGADYSLPTELPAASETPILPGLQKRLDRAQGRKTAPAKENIPRIVSVAE